MATTDNKRPSETTQVENREWAESLRYVYEKEGPERVREILEPRMQKFLDFFGARKPPLPQEATNEIGVLS